MNSSSSSCSSVHWFYHEDAKRKTEFMVYKGSVVKTSAGADRMSLSRNCSLVINSITAEDAGRYTNRPEGNAAEDVAVI